MTVQRYEWERIRIEYVQGRENGVDLMGVHFGIEGDGQCFTTGRFRVGEISGLVTEGAQWLGEVQREWVINRAGDASVSQPLLNTLPV